LAAVPGGAGIAQAQSVGEGPGAVFSMTNDPTGNSITVFNRASDGTLTRAEDVPTGGIGTGTAEDSANGLIRANTAGESHRRTPEGTAKYLLALNGGSDSISVFRNAPSGLLLVDSEPAGGKRPISITVNRGVA